MNMSEINFRKKELEKCKKDIVYFAENYFYVSQCGIYKKLKLNDFQRNLLSKMQNNFKISALSRRYIGKTTICLCYCAWKLIFFPYRQIALICPNRQTKEKCFEILNKAFEKMQNWLKPKLIKIFCPREFQAVNGSSIQIETYNSSKVNFCGKFTTDLILDEYNFSDEWFDKNGYIFVNYAPINILSISAQNPWTRCNLSRTLTISRALSKGNCEWLIVKNLVNN